jgi:hypothetical protein
MPAKRARLRRLEHNVQDGLAALRGARAVMPGSGGCAAPKAVKW